MTYQPHYVALLKSFSLGSNDSKISFGCELQNLCKKAVGHRVLFAYCVLKTVNLDILPFPHTTLAYYMVRKYVILDAAKERKKKFNLFVASEISFDI